MQFSTFNPPLPPVVTAPPVHGQPLRLEPFQFPRSQPAQRPAPSPQLLPRQLYPLPPAVCRRHRSAGSLPHLAMVPVPFSPQVAPNQSPLASPVWPYPSYNYGQPYSYGSGKPSYSNSTTGYSTPGSNPYTPSYTTPSNSASYSTSASASASLSRSPGGSPRERRRGLLAGLRVIFADLSERYPVTPLALVPAPLAEHEMLRTQIYPHIVTKKYTASALDANRAHLLVYEYPLGNQWVIWDYESGFVHLTGLWRAALYEQALQRNRDGVVHVKPNAKADIVKLLESMPQALHLYIKRVRGGFLKIQGTWVPFHLCKRLATTFCYYIRWQLVPIFGADFPGLCLRPGDPGFGELRYDVGVTPGAPDAEAAPDVKPDVNNGTETSGISCSDMADIVSVSKCLQLLRHGDDKAKMNINSLIS